MTTIGTRCAIAGGGPAGMMLGFLLARAGIDVFVLEKHGDFLRDFRGDTIHPSTLELMYELGILDRFLARPHEEVRTIKAEVGQESVTLGDFTHLPTHCKFLGLMPQWDFLDFIRQEASAYPAFHVMMKAEATDLIEEDGVVKGLRAHSEDGPLEIRAAVTVAADGRSSVIRERSGLKVTDLGAPMDVLWMRIARRPSDPPQTFGHADHGKILVQINRETYWQCGLVIPKGEADAMRARGIEEFRNEIAALAPHLRDRVGDLKGWNDVSLLSVKVDRMEHWSRPGFLAIGDAAHAMSPIGGVGINLAIQDAVAAANILAPVMRERDAVPSELREVQRRRDFPTRATQFMQVTIQNKVISRVLGSNKQLHLPWTLRLLDRFPVLRRIPARLVGLGFRPEHIRSMLAVLGLCLLTAVGSSAQTAPCTAHQLTATSDAGVAAGNGSITITVRNSSKTLCALSRAPMVDAYMADDRIVHEKVRWPVNASGSGEGSRSVDVAPGASATFIIHTVSRTGLARSKKCASKLDVRLAPGKKPMLTIEAESCRGIEASGFTLLPKH